MDLDTTKFPFNPASWCDPELEITQLISENTVHTPQLDINVI